MEGGAKPARTAFRRQALNLCNVNRALTILLSDNLDPARVAARRLSFRLSVILASWTSRAGAVDGITRRDRR
jgi:hypothetical protein